MKKLLLIALSTSLAMGANAADEHKFYAGGGLSLWNVDTGVQGRTHINLSSIDGLVGYEVLPWLAVEGRVGAGVERDKTETLSDFYDFAPVDGSDGVTSFQQDSLILKSELNYYASFYLKPQIKNDIAVFYGLIGFTTYDSEFETIQQTFEGEYIIDDSSEGDGELIITSFGPMGDPTYGTYSESEVSFSMGVGVGFYFHDRYTVNFEWKNLVQSKPFGDTEGELGIQGVTANVTYSF
jgi:opacity protein-like surface antigen